MDYNEKIHEINKYFFVLIVKKKAGVIAKGNNIDIVLEDLHKIINERNGRLEERTIAKLELIEVPKDIFEDNERSKIKTIGGPIEIKIKFYRVQNNSIEKIDEYIKDNSVFLTDNFLANNKLDNQKIKYLTYLANNNCLHKELFVLNIIDNLFK